MSKIRSYASFLRSGVTRRSVKDDDRYGTSNRHSAKSPYVNGFPEDESYLKLNEHSQGVHMSNITTGPTLDRRQLSTRRADFENIEGDQPVYPEEIHQSKQMV